MAFDLNQLPAASEDDEDAAVTRLFDLKLQPRSSFDLNIAADDEGGMNELVLADNALYTDHVLVTFDEEELDDSTDEENEVQDNQPPPGTNGKRRKYLTDQQRQQVYEAVLWRSNNGKIRRNTTAIVAAMFNVKRSYVQAIWRTAKKCMAQGIPVDVRSKRRTKCGRKKILIDLSLVKTIPLKKRTTIRALAQELHVNKSTLHNRFKDGLLRRHSNTLKPLLKDSNKLQRLQYCVSMIDPQSLGREPTFLDMSNIIHIDEKWFNGTKKVKKFYMLPDEEDPLLTVHNKNSIHKVMFLSAIAKPLKDEQGRIIFDGKLGIWPFVRKEPAKRTSIHRPAGSLVTKPMTVTRDTSRAFLITKVIPAILARWPAQYRNRTIWIQQDNARTHVAPDDQEFSAAVAHSGLDIRLMNQPPNSPDMNVLDLGFFSSMQSKTYLHSARNMDELVANVEKEFTLYDHGKITRVYLTLQLCLIEIMKHNGGNGYKLPHMSKEALEAAANLPTTLPCDARVYDAAIAKIAAYQQHLL